MPTLIKIPKENIMTEYDEEVLDALYKILQEEYDTAIEEKKEPEKLVQAETTV